MLLSPPPFFGGVASARGILGMSGAGLFFRENFQFLSPKIADFEITAEY